MPCVCSSLHTSFCDAPSRFAKRCQGCIFSFSKVELATERVSPAIHQFWNWFACYSLHGSSLFRSGDGHDHAEVSFYERQSRNGDNKVVHESGTTCPRFVDCEAQWFQDLIHEVIMCVVRGWPCEVRCGHDDWHVDVGLFPLCSCV